MIYKVFITSKLNPINNTLRPNRGGWIEYNKFEYKNLLTCKK